MEPYDSPPSPGHETVDERLRRVAASRAPREGVAAEQGARERLGERDTLQAELDRLRHGLEAAGARPGAALPQRPGDGSGPAR